MEIFIARGKDRKGPYSEDSIRQFLADGQLDGTELAWHEGLDGWVNVKEVMDSAAPSIAQDSDRLDRSKIFISYRRKDSEDVTGRIHDRLTQKFTPETIFRDVDNIPIGVDFRRHLDQQLAECRVLLAVVGRQWAQDLRLQEESDFVRIEIEHGLEPGREIIVVPVLVGNAPMPSVNQLPPSLKDFAYRNAIKVRPDPDFHKDMDKLTRDLEGLLDVPLADEQSAVIKAAEEGDAEAQFKKGTMYHFGEGVEQDYEEAAKWYRKAAEGGNARAQYNLGFMYRDGQGVEQDHEEALKWFRKAAEQGDAMAQNDLGSMYYNSRGVEQDHEESLKWYRKAAEQGDVKGQYNLGAMYHFGKGVEQDYEEAVKWYRKAAEQGYAKALVNLGVMYRDGEGVEQDYEEAVKLFRKAAEQGYAGGQTNLGWMYHKGQGVEQNYKEAAKRHRKAAWQGDVFAQYELGELYANGQGVLEDQVSAYAWYNIAATNGHAKAKEAKEKAEKEMSPDQKAEGQKLAREMLEKNPKLLND